MPRRWMSLLLVALGALPLLGCLDEPEIEDRWTRLDVLASAPLPYEVLPSGSTPTITVSADVTYRSIVTGFAVAELRASTLPAAGVVLHPDAPRLQMARDIDRILQNSVTRGRATRAITGWDHLVQRIDFTFTGWVPSVGDTSAAGLFLICYLGSGQEVELANGTDSLVVTPFPSEPNELLPVGLELVVGP